VLDWLNHPEQIDFIRRQHLAALLQ
jgi:hypothetical protein